MSFCFLVQIKYLKKEKIGSKGQFKLKQRQVAIASIVILISLIIGAYIYDDGAISELSGAQAAPIIIHIHSQLSITMDGKPMKVPSQIGIDPSLWNDNSLDEYGMQAMPEMGMSGMAPLHTHDDSGIIHVESSINRDYTLGEFFKTWGLDLEGKTIKATVDGKPIAEFESIVLKDGEKIILDIKGN